MITGGCSLSRNNDSFAKMEEREVTNSVRVPEGGGPPPTESDLAFARNAASDVLTKGDKDFEPAVGKSRNRRARVGDAARAGLFVGRAHLQGFFGKLC